MFQASFRSLVSVAHRFVNGEASFWAFYYACSETRREMRGLRLHRKVAELIHEWSSLAERCRNEFGEASAPLSEQQVRERVSRAFVERDV